MRFADVQLKPSPTALPGSAVLQQFANGLAAWALIGALIAFVVGAAMWALGSHAQNMHQSSTGRRAVITSVAAAQAGPACQCGLPTATGSGIRHCH